MAVIPADTSLTL